MTTKRIERTMLECGKSAASKGKRKKFMRTVRKNTKVKLMQFCQDPSLADDIILMSPDDTHYSWEHEHCNYRMHVIDRIIDSKAGQPWQAVRHQIMQICKHVNAKIRRSIISRVDWLEEWPDGDFNNRFIDDNGIMRLKTYTLRQQRPSLTTDEYWQLKQTFLDWISDRKIEKVGSKYFWMVRLTRHRQPYETGDWPYYRQGQELSSEDVTFLLSVPKWFKKDYFSVR